MSNKFMFQSNEPLTVGQMNALLQDVQLTDETGASRELIMTQKGTTDAVEIEKHERIAAVAGEAGARGLAVQQLEAQIAGMAESAEMQAALSGKVDKEAGKTLVSEQEKQAWNNKADQVAGMSMVSEQEKQSWNGKSNFSGNYNDLSNRPASLPANGGNADTLDGLHAASFVRARLSGTTLYITTDGTNP